MKPGQALKNVTAYDRFGCNKHAMKTGGLVIVPLFKVHVDSDGPRSMATDIQSVMAPHVLTRRTLWLALWLLMAFSLRSVHGQTAQDLSQVKTIYLAPLANEHGSRELFASLVKQLRKSRKFQLLDSPTKADATLAAAGQMWVKGYFETNPRSPGSSRHAVYGGFLSAELHGKDNQVLWSYLVTPTKFYWSSVPDDLSADLGKQLVIAVGRNEPVSGAGEPASLVRTSLQGAGATFPAPLYEKWFESFEEKNPQVRINYQAVGSEAGTRLLEEHKVDFATSDVPPDASAAQARTGVVRIASVLGAVVPIYNLKNLAGDLKFTPEILAGIYLGRIRRWNDPSIRSANKGVALPNADITVIHRSDGSGTTYAWSDYLSKTNSEWKTLVGTGTSLTWPVGEGVERNEGVAAEVQQIPNAIGYVELVYAIQHQLSFGLVRNSSGQFIRASLETVTQAAKTAGLESKTPASITNSPGKNAYPIVTFTWFVLPQSIGDSAKKSALFELLRWVLTDGQRQCSALGYSPLPQGITSQELELIHNVR